MSSTLRLSIIMVFLLATAALGLIAYNMILPKALGVQFVLLLACMAYDLFTRKRVHVAYLWCTGAFFLWVFGAIFGGTTRPWLAIAHWITGV